MHSIVIVNVEACNIRLRILVDFELSLLLKKTNKSKISKSVNFSYFFARRPVFEDLTLVLRNIKMMNGNYCRASE